MTTYQVKFQRAGVEDLPSEPFKTLHEAQTFAAKHEIEFSAGRIIIVELGENGEEGQIHEVVKPNA